MVRDGILLRIGSGQCGARELIFLECVAMTGDGRLAVSASEDRTLGVWDLETGRRLRTLAGHLDSVWGVALGADERLAVSDPEDKSLKLWDLETGRIIATFSCHSATKCCAFDGNRNIIAGDHAGRVHFLSNRTPRIA